MIISFVYGTEQVFRHRLDDITIQGRLHAAAMPIRGAAYRLNDSAPVPFYVEEIPDLLFRAGRAGALFATPVDWRTGYKDSPAALRLKRLGDFTLEIPVSSPGLRVGRNVVHVDVDDHGKVSDRATMHFEWNPAPLDAVLDLTDLSSTKSILDVGQVVNGQWDVDPERNHIRCATPADPDSLLLLGSPHASQEATYRIVVSEPRKAKYLGLSDFFVRNEDEDPPLGIKPGYSTAGLATLRYDGEARSWVSFGDNAHRHEGWLAVTDPPATFFAESAVAYRVRHQVVFHEGNTSTRFRVWAEGATEPAQWLCEASDSALSVDRPRFSEASFGLFMHTGVGSAWSDIRVRPLDVAEGERQ